MGGTGETHIFGIFGLRFFFIGPTAHKLRGHKKAAMSIAYTFKKHAINRHSLQIVCSRTHGVGDLRYLDAVVKMPACKRPLIVVTAS